MIGPAVLAWMGHQSGKTFEEGERLEHKGAGAVAPGPPEVPFDLAVAADLETALGEGWARDVADQGFEAISVMGVNAGGRVQGVTLGVGSECGRIGNCLGARTEVHRRALQARDPAAGIGTEGDAILDRRGLKEREEGVCRVVGGCGVRFRARAIVIARADQVAAAGGAESAVDAAHGIPVYSLDLGGGEFIDCVEIRRASGATEQVHSIEEERVEVDVQTEDWLLVIRSPQGWCTVTSCRFPNLVMAWRHFNR